MVKPQLCIPSLCFVFVFCMCDFRTFVYSPGQMPIRTMFPGFCTIVGGPYKKWKWSFTVIEFLTIQSGCFIQIIILSYATVCCSWVFIHSGLFSYHDYQLTKIDNIFVFFCSSAAWYQTLVSCMRPLLTCLFIASPFQFLIPSIFLQSSNTALVHYLRLPSGHLPLIVLKNIYLLYVFSVHTLSISSLLKRLASTT